MKNRLNLLAIFVLAVIGTGLSLQAVTTAEKQGIVLKVVDYSEKPETLLFTTHSTVSSGSLVKAKVFINKGFVPVRVILHNKSNEPVKISTNSVSGLADMERIFCCFQSNQWSNSFHLIGTTFIVGGLAWSTGFINVFERDVIRNGHGYWWYPVTTAAGCVSALLVAASLYDNYQYDKRSKQCLEQHILNKPIIIPPRGRVEKLLLFDLNNRPMTLDFDVHDLHDSVVASFKKISLEDEQHDKK